MFKQCCFGSWEGLDDWGLPYSGEAECRARTQYQRSVFRNCETTLRGDQAGQLGMGASIFYFVLYRLSLLSLASFSC